MASRLSDELPGTWQLISRVDLTESGERRIDPLLGEDPVALLIYDRAGHFAAQFMKRDRSGPSIEAPAGGAPNNTRPHAGYDAYFGTYTVDDALDTVTQRVLGSLSKDNVGQVLTRAATVRDDVLVIRLPTASIDGTPLLRTLSFRRVG